MDRRLQQLLDKKSYNVLGVGKEFSWNFDVPDGYSLTAMDLYIRSKCTGTPNAARLAYHSSLMESIKMGTRMKGTDVIMMDLADSECIDMAAVLSNMFKANELYRKGARREVCRDYQMTAAANKTILSHWNLWTPLPIRKGTILINTVPASTMQSDLTAVESELFVQLSYERTHGLSSTYSMLSYVRTNTQHRIRNVDKFAAWGNINLATDSDSVILGDAGRIGSDETKDRQILFADEVKGYAADGATQDTSYIKTFKNPRGATKYASPSDSYGIYHVNKKPELCGLNMSSEKKVGLFGMSRLPDVANMR